MKRLIFVADSESQVIPAYRLAEYFQDQGWDITGYIVQSKNAPSRRQIISGGVYCSLQAGSLKHLFEQESLFACDAICVLLPGSGLYGFLHLFQDALRVRNLSRRPLLLTGYNGVVYEKHLEGLLWRVGYDVIAVNSRSDRARFTSELADLGIRDQAVICTGLLHAQEPALALEPLPRGMIKSLVFATQAMVPLAKPERVYLLEKLKDYADTHPDRKVIIKPRSLPWERTFHQEELPYELLYQEIYGSHRPSNLLFAYGPLRTYLVPGTVLVTVSSTAVFEALALSAHGVVLSDLGIKESLGNHFFKDSGMLGTMDSILRDELPLPHRDWLAENGFHTDDSLAALHGYVEATLARQEREQRPLPMRGPYYGPGNAPFLYESQLPLKAGSTRALEAESASLSRKAQKLVRAPLRFIRDSRLFRDE